LKPGDLVLVDGNAIYPGGATLAASGGQGAAAITIRGRRVHGRRPVISGVTAQGAAVLKVLGSHYVIEGLDLTAGGDPRVGRCFYNVGDQVILRDSVVHDCHLTGIAGSDVSGSLTLDHVEVCRCGDGLYAHQIYVGSSLAKYPRALFRMQYCYVHDGAGGNNVKSRVTRNEIEYNWIEGATYHELDLVGPDPKAQKIPAAAHCDADIIGNVFVKRPGSLGAVARFGTDGTASSRGNYRLVNNTIVIHANSAAAGGVFWLKGELGSFKAWNNVFWSAAPLSLMRQDGGAMPPILGGAGNWVAGLHGVDPGFLSLATDDFRPGPGSPLIAAGAMPPAGTIPVSVPPMRGDVAAPPVTRPPGRARDIGAFPFIAQ
jgi:hypothetical protein